jgi:hypothetical protein
MSPFYPGQPVPTELFVGRSAQIDRIMLRGAAQVEQGKPVAFFVQGEYGIGKSSLARFVQWKAEKSNHLMGIYVNLGGASCMNDVGAAVLQAAAAAGSLEPKHYEKVQEWLAKYIGEQTLFGITIHAEALKRESPTIAQGPLPFLREIFKRCESEDTKGIFLVFDEINGVAADKKFAHFIKGLVDDNALSKRPLPLLLMLCGVEERRRQMITAHQPVERIFDVVDIESMTTEEMEQFFLNAFEQVNVEVDRKALDTMAHWSAGFPKIMHLMGDNAFWADQDGRIDEHDALLAVLNTAEDVGRKYVQQQVYRALRSEDYKAILDKLASRGLNMVFRKGDIAQSLSETQKRKLNNFLQKMKKLNVIRSGDSMGEYVFNSRMVSLYIWWEGVKKKPTLRRT